MHRNTLTCSVVCAVASVCMAGPASGPALIAGAAPGVTFESLLREMVDRDAIARWPDPAYTCKQFSSYDRASTSPADEKTWFANGDHGQFIRTIERQGRTERVMMDATGPGAVVRIWSANPGGTLRVYVDGGATPVIEAPMEEVLGGKWAVGPVTVGGPLAGTRSRGWNSYLPIPYASSCVITSDSTEGFYYQINYRAYEAGTSVTSFDVGTLARSADTLRGVQEELAGAPKRSEYIRNDFVDIPPGQLHSYVYENGKSEAVTGLQIDLAGRDQEQALRSTVLRMEFDGAETVWCPISDFFGCGVGKPTAPFRTWYTGISGSGLPACRWVMPFQRSVRIVLENTGREPVRVQVYVRLKDWTWDERSMHFHATWRQEHPLHAYGGRGTRDFNYVEIAGRGVYAGDALAVMNPVPEWWGEGDEKIYVDGETFPSHFGTGTEDYYGYAWCWYEPFTHAFHAQSRCDGNAEKNNWGHTTVTRVRSLDAIPFRGSLKMDMEVWHWKECDVAYAATTYFYALPGATTNRGAEPAESARAIPRPPPLPPPFKVTGAVECEDLRVIGQSADLKVGKQDMRSFKRGAWSGESHLWVQGRQPGDFVELEVPATGTAKRFKVTLYPTKSWDYGVVRFTVNGQKAGKDTDLFSGGQGRCAPGAPVDLGVFAPRDGKLTLRAEVVGANPGALGSKSYLGLDCVVLTPMP